MRNKVMVVDDMPINCDILEEILEDEYDVITVGGGKLALEVLTERHEEISALLLDLMMPEVDGFAVLEFMKNHGWMDKVPVIIISGENTVEAERRCFDMGVSDFIQKPFDNSLVRRRVSNVAELFSYKNQLEEKVAKQTEILRKQAAKLQKSNTELIDILATVVEGRNMESGLHVKRVKGFTRILALQMMKDYPEYRLTPAMVEVIAAASALHDVGKIAIPDNILLKPGKLTDEEFACMKTHTTRGSEILSDIKGVWDENYSKMSYEICRHHHERYDGRGYPDGLAGDDIPLSAQIVGVADVYDALVTERCYKKPFTTEEAFQMITGGKCGTFSPKLMEAFTRARADFEELARSRE
ncbi:MAG: response regulator [Lachnospiraceae bacterium]|nr:response regulator [Lachnospiraceae bacterium]